jgi:hypothetical protein
MRFEKDFKFFSLLLTRYYLITPVCSKCWYVFYGSFTGIRWWQASKRQLLHDKFCRIWALEGWQKCFILGNYVSARYWSCFRAEIVIVVAIQTHKPTVVFVSPSPVSILCLPLCSSLFMIRVLYCWHVAKDSVQFVI